MSTHADWKPVAEPPEIEPGDSLLVILAMSNGGKPATSFGWYLRAAWRYPRYGLPVRREHSGFFSLCDGLIDFRFTNATHWAPMPENRPAEAVATA